MIEQLPTPAGTPLPHMEPVVKAKKSMKNHSKPLLFINHDAKHLKSQATRSEITSHLRSAYQPWKHRMQARARREAGKPVVALKSSKNSTGSDEESFLKKITYHEPTRDSQPPKLSFLDETEDPNSNFLSLTPPPVLYQGNSDPFSALSFKITPLIAELIKFEHAHLHPCIYSTKNTPSRAYGTSYLADMHGPASEQAAVYGYLSRAAIVLSSASGDPRFKTAALVLKGRSSALLRTQLATGEVKGDILRKILALMIAELFAHEYQAALVHSRILMGLLEARSQSAGQGDEFDMRFFFSVVYSEVQRSCMSLTRPCFDVSASGWVTRLFESVGGDAYRSLISTLHIDDTPLEPSVLGLELAGIFGEVRTVRLVSQEYSNSPVYGAPTPLALYLPARVVLCLGKMVSFYMDHCAGRSVLDLLPRELIHRAAVLGALYWVRKAGHIDSIRISSTSTIHSAGPMILTRLRESLGRFDGIAGSMEREMYGDLRFWALYIGAQEEQGRAKNGEVVEKWFTARLVEASRDIGVYTWQQARPILERYPHPDAAEPHGSTWFSSIFVDVSTSSACLGGVFARDGHAITTAESRKPELGATLYGSGDDYMTWSTEQPMALEMSSMVNGELTCAMLRQSIQPALARETTFACPSRDVGQGSYWVAASESRNPEMLGDEGEGYLDVSGGNDLEGNDVGIGGPARPVVFDFDFSPDGQNARCVGTQEAQEKLAADILRIEEYHPVTGWIGEQQQTWAPSTKTPAKLAHCSFGSKINLKMNIPVPKSQSQSQVHPFHSSAQRWQSSSEAEAEAENRSTKNGYRFTPRMNDPKLTGIETGPVAFASYPAREMDEAEALAEARRIRSSPQKRDWDRDEDRISRVWETLKVDGDERCVMIAESWEHGVNCSWGGECPIMERR